MAREIWKLIPSQPGYEVSSHGQVRSVDRTVQTVKGPRSVRGRVLRPGKSSNGYFTVACGSGNSRLVHELVLETFVGPRPDGKISFHRDDIRTNNTQGNLTYDTPAANNKNITFHGKRLFTYAQAEEIRTRLNSGETPLEISEKYGCTRRHIYNIKNRVQYVQD